jgi:hypothetical protein
MTDHALIFLLLPLVACGVSVIYFLSAPKSASPKELALGSLHGVLIAVLTVVAFVRLNNSLFEAADQLNPLYLLSLIAPPVLIALAFKVFRGKRAVHVYQVVNLLCYLELLVLCSEVWKSLRIRM